jgi:hypothetical protein
MKKLLIVILLTACATDPGIRRQQIALNVATVIDMESTFAGLRRCGDGCAEGNPLLAGPVDRGRLIAYGLQFALNALAIHMAERAKDRPRSFWKYLPFSLTVGHGVAAALNLRFLMESDVVVPPVPLDEIAHARRD